MTEGVVQKKRFAHWLHIPAQIIVAGFCLYWYFHLPVPNKAVLVLTGVTVVMALLDMHPGHKAVYLLLVICLMFIENRAINRDRAEIIKTEDDRRRDENTQFQSIANGLKVAIENGHRQFDETMSRLNATIDRVGDSIKTQTGGDSFAYITFTPEPGYVQFNQLPQIPGGYFLVCITSHGKYPMKQIHATMMDDERRLAAVAEYNKHPDGDWMKAINNTDTHYDVPYLRPQSPEAPNGQVEPIGAYPLTQADSKRLSIGFSSLNGYWNETLHLGRINGKWHQCLSVMDRP